MFKMNPAAKEFVPAHLLKKRQEEADRLGELTEQLDKVNINQTAQPSSNSNNVDGGDDGKSKTAQKVQENSSPEQKEQSKSDVENSTTIKSEPSNQTSKNSTEPQQKNDHSISNDNSRIAQERQSNGQQVNNLTSNNNHNEGEYSDQALQDLIDEEDDRFLLNAGENICEFNGEQFIIPGE